MCLISLKRSQFSIWVEVMRVRSESMTSVSRCHAMIKYQSDGLYIEDNKSKFGTLVLLKEAYNLEPEYTSAV